jgi:hypothetical protein
MSAEIVRPASDAPTLVVSIVNWRTAPLVIECLRSIADDAQRPPLQVIVVDNASGDDSVAQIEDAVATFGWGQWVQVLQAEKNAGFASGNNVAIRAALRAFPGFGFFHLLNPDTLVRPGAFQVLLEFLRQHPRVGVAGGRSEDADTTPQICCFRFPTVLGEFAAYLRLSIVDRALRRWTTPVGIPEQPTQVGWVSGAHMMICRDVIDAIGLMDEGYFLYFEETDYTLRAARAGWECWHVPASRIVHLVGQSSGVTLRDGKPRRLPKYWFQSRRRYFVLNHGRAYAALTDILVLVAYGARRLRRLLQRKPHIDPPHFAGDLLRYGALLNGRGSLEPRRTGS